MSRNQINKPRILFVSRRWPPSTGGMERYAFDLYSSLDNKADIYLLKFGGKNYLLPLVIPIFFIRSIWILSTKQIDIIHMQDGLLSPMGAILKLIFRKPLTSVIHGLDVTYDNGLYQAIIPKALNYSSNVFSISNAAAEEAVRRGVNKNKIVVIPLGITDDLFINDKPTARSYIFDQLAIEDSGQILLITVGRLVKRKGVVWFINNVLGNLVRRDKEVLYLVCGDGPEKTNIDLVAEDNGLRENVFLLGRISEKHIRALYNGSDIFVMPNIPVTGDLEGFGRVLLEASLCEIPIVASGIEGIKDAINDGENGLLLDAKDEGAYTSKLNVLIGSASKREQIGKKSRSYSLKTYNWDNISDQYMFVYTSLFSD